MKRRAANQISDWRAKLRGSDQSVSLFLEDPGLEKRGKLRGGVKPSREGTIKGRAAEAEREMTKERIRLGGGRARSSS